MTHAATRSAVRSSVRNVGEWAPHGNAAVAAPLDNFTDGLWQACSLSKLLTSYAGPCVRIRRSSDGQESDIGFSGSSFDGAAALAFVGGGDGFIKTLYDQSGGSNHLTQSASANQPKIIGSGINLGEIVFDGSDDILSSANTVGTPTALFVLMRATLRGTGSAQILFEHGDNWVIGSNNNAVAYWNGTGALESGMSELGIGNRSLGIYTGLQPNGQVLCLAYDRQQATNGNAVYVFADGIRQTRSSSNNAAFKPDGMFTDLSINIGARAGGVVASTLNLYHAVIYKIAKTDSEVSQISALLP